MDLLREREMKEGLERQLNDEQKKKEVYLKRFRRERRNRRLLEDQLDIEKKRRMQLEDALKNSGASEELRRINGKDHYNNLENKSSNQKASSSCSSQNQRSTPNIPDRDQMTQERMKQEPIDTPPISYPQPIREPPPPTQPIDTKPWCYSGIDLINNGAAFWQSYSDSLAQELEMERKSRQQQLDREKSPLPDRSSYYKNSVLFTSSAT